ncbi:MAG: hypothetical protein H6739_01765 [Alphaproteobacteria bacterium]|nr:hypothetical protein [Alphaproteobacteria bacterium]
MTALLTLLLACSGPEPDTADPCVQGDTLTWANWGDGFFATYCRACHSATTPDRKGAPAGVDFDTWPEVVEQSAAVRSAVLERGTMPLGGGVHAEDLDRLARYLDCATAEGEPADDPVPWSTFGEPEWDAATLEGRLSDALALGFPTARPLIDAYLALMARGDDTCPGDPRQITDVHLYGCTAESGVTYSGITEFMEEPFTDGDHEILGQAVVGDARIDAPEGSFLLGGHFGEYAGVNTVTGERLVQWELQGTSLWSGGEGWMVDGYSALLRAEHGWLDSGRFVTLSGAISYGGVSIDFSEVALHEDTCGWAAEGLLLLRDPSGGWFSAALEPCAPCVALSFEGEPMPEDLCPDLAPLAEALVGETP